ncbi:transposase family protein [Streptomyces sp. NPDC088246]|uniref:transposase family protein n=1 Tax=Streptomyces sp. NPDC088246 TaxID=3365842 RepID=UPI00380AD65D
MIVLAVLRHDQRLADMAGGNNVSESTVRRGRDELITLLAAQAPCLDRALEKIADDGGVVVLLDGTLVRTRRRTGTENRKNYSGKHKSHGLLFLALTDEKGNLIWISAAKPGRSSEIATARHNKITEHLREAKLGALADLGFVCLDDDPDNPVIITGRKATHNHRLTDAEKEANRLLSRERAAVEYGFANLKPRRHAPTAMNRHPAPPSSADVAANYCRQTAERPLRNLRRSPLTLSVLQKRVDHLTEPDGHLYHRIQDEDGDYQISGSCHWAHVGRCPPEERNSFAA